MVKKDYTPYALMCIAVILIFSPDIIYAIDDPIAKIDNTAKIWKGSLWSLITTILLIVGGVATLMWLKGWLPIKKWVAKVFIGAALVGGLDKIIAYAKALL